MEPQGTSRRTRDNYTGCLLAGAAGDALGGPTEFMKIDEIRRRFGPQGQTGYAALNQHGQAEFTDDTQMTLFTAEGLLDALEGAGTDGQPGYLPAIWQAYQRWLTTQDSTPPQKPQTGLLAHRALWETRAPGMTCLTALRGGKPGTIEHKLNNSKGCGGVMRVAPIGMLLPGKQAFRLGVEAAALTHSHPSGYLSAGVLAEIIAWLAYGLTLEAAIAAALETLVTWPEHSETRNAVQLAQRLAFDPHVKAEPETVERMGGGWVGEEALAISLYCALKRAAAGSLREGVLLAVNHSGDNDSTGAITGNILGMLLGKSAIPAVWVERLEMKDEIEAIARKLLAAVS